MKIAYNGIIALAIALLELALLPIMLSIGGKSIGIIPQLFYVFLIGSVTSVTVSYAADRMSGLKRIVHSGRLLIIIIVIGLLNDVISQLLLGIGTIGTNPVVAATIFRSWVIMAALLVPITLRQRVTKMQLFATFVGFSGVYILASGGTLVGISLTTLPFILILLGSALCTVYPNLAMKQYNVDTFGAIALFNISSLIFMFLLAIGTNTSIYVPISGSVMITILFLGIATYGIGTSLYYYALKTFGPLFTGNSILVVPFLTIVFSFLILGTPIYAYYIVAALFLSVGIVMQRTFTKVPEHIKPKHMMHDFTMFDITSAFVNNKNPTILQYMAGNNRALAIKLNGNVKIKDKDKKIFERFGCLAFTNKDWHPEVRSQELEFINDIIGTEVNSTIVIGIGNADRLDYSFEEFMKSGKKTAFTDFTNTKNSTNKI